LALLAARQFAQVPDEVIRRLAPKLGSDVPFFVSHHLDRTKQATVLGRGEVVEPIIARQRHSVLLLLPNLHVSTPEVFKVFDTLPPPPDDGSPDFAAWSWLPAMELLPLLRNDLEAAAFMIAPSLGELRDHCERQLARPVRMSGSGSSLFTLYDADAEADEARESSDLPVASIVV
jgi:4-diphosphocytidyl-2-C-methyl-D-erythritol kinase